MNKLAHLDFSELKLGYSKKTKKKITQKLIADFAELSGDFHPLHTDQNFAIKTGHKNIIAHGLLISSLAAGLIGMQLPGKNSMIISQSFKYLKPAYPEDILLIRGKIDTIDERFRVIKIIVDIFNQSDKKIAAGIFEVIMKK